MCDAAYCARLHCGTPVASLDALRALASVLHAISAAAESASSGTPTPEESANVPPSTTDAAELSLRDPRNRPPTAPSTPDVMETLAELLLAAMTALRDGEAGDEPEDQR
jgi:hypothetical protein